MIGGIGRERKEERRGGVSESEGSGRGEEKEERKGEGGRLMRESGDRVGARISV